MWDRVTIEDGKPRFVHLLGANVFHFDGHVAFVRYPGKFPMTETAVRILAELDSMGTSGQH
jgi:prepilin-type processing-associated H-X9-DG protein